MKGEYIDADINNEGGRDWRSLRRVATLIIALCLILTLPYMGFYKKAEVLGKQVTDRKQIGRGLYSEREGNPLGSRHSESTANKTDNDPALMFPHGTPVFLVDEPPPTMPERFNELAWEHHQVSEEVRILREALAVMEGEETPQPDLPSISGYTREPGDLSDKSYRDMAASLHSWLYEQATKLLEGDQRRQEIIHRVNCLLESRGSLCVGMGEIFVLAQEETGVSLALVLGIMDAESSMGRSALARNNHNGWGMLGSRVGIEMKGRGCWWPNWTEAIYGAHRWIDDYCPDAQTATDMIPGGYCEGASVGSAWWQTVETIRTSL